MEPSITCPKCKMTSYHPKDIQHGYCGNCHEYTGGTSISALIDDLINEVAEFTQADYSGHVRSAEQRSKDFEDVLAYKARIIEAVKEGVK